MSHTTANYAVIFRARPRALDGEYSRTAERLRKLALEDYGCIEFTSACEDGQEIAISYWMAEEDIQRWKVNAEHRLAQESGRDRWYESYSVEIVRITRRYDRRMQDE